MAGRPSLYTKDISNKIIDIISTSNRSLASICKELNISPSSVYLWLENNKEFSDMYARAKEWQADFMAEEILEIADDATNDFMTVTKGDITYEAENKEVISRSRLRVESRKWLASKLKPRKYAETVKTEVTGKDGKELNESIDYSKLSDETIRAVLAATKPEELKN